MSVRILTGDCRDLLPGLALASVDCVITDPPYGQTSLTWDQRVTGWLQLLRPLLKPSGSVWVFGSARFFMEGAAEFVGWTIAQDVIWEKHNGSNSFADRFRRVHEQAVHLYPADAAWADVFKNPLYTNDARAKTVRRKQRPPQWGKIGESSYRSEDGGPRLMRSVMFARSEHGRAEHPTQKPVHLIAPLIEYSCPAGGLVLDPFAGSGSVGLAAQATGRSAVLIEADPHYAELATRRLGEDAPMLAGAT